MFNKKIVIKEGAYVVNDLLPSHFWLEIKAITQLTTKPLSGISYLFNAGLRLKYGNG